MVDIWGVVESHPDVRGDAWLEEWFSAQRWRMAQVGQNYNDVRVEAHNAHEEAALDTVHEGDHQGWICEHVLDISIGPSTRYLWGQPVNGTFDPVAPERGVPDQMSPFSRAYFESWKRRSPAGKTYLDCFGQSHLSLRELREKNWTSDVRDAGQSDNRLGCPDVISDDWFDLFERMEKIEQERNTEDVRLTVWFDR